MFKDVINQLPIDEAVKEQLAKLTPETYTGLATKLTEMAIKEIQT